MNEYPRLTLACMPLPAPSTSLGLRTSEELALSPPDGLQSTFYTRCPRRDPRALGVSFQPQVRISSSVFPLERGQGWGRRGPPGGGTHPAGNPPPPPPPSHPRRQPQTRRRPTRSTSRRLGAPGRRSPALPPPPPPPPPRSPLAVPARSRLRPGPAGLPRRLSVRPAPCRSVRPWLAPRSRVRQRPCPRRVTWPRGGPRTRARPRPSGGRRGARARSRPSRLQAARPGRCGGPRGGGAGPHPAATRATLRCSSSLPGTRPPRAAQRSTLPGPPLLKNPQWLQALSSLIRRGLSLKAGRHPPTP